MNKHIELVKKWLNDPSSVTIDELLINSDDAYAAIEAASYDPANVADDATYAVLEAVDYAAYAADADDAAHWVKRYEELSE